MPETSVAHLLAREAEILNNYGPESEELIEFCNQHKDNQEFVDLSKVAIRLWNRLNPQRENNA